jgi:hypothetical protein
MQRLAFCARLRLVPTDEGGRMGPIRSDYRPSFSLGGTWQGRPSLNDGRVMLLGPEELAPGEEGLVRIDPLCAESWGNVRTSMVLAMQEGSRIVGHATITDVARPDGFTPVVATFVCRAREFCSFVDEASTLPLSQRLLGARERLLDLYSAAVPLPSVEPPAHEDEVRSIEPPADWKGFDLQEPVAGSLSDDLLDVYRDVGKGLRLWDADALTAATWEWRFSFESHWGDHAIDALRALHRVCKT